MALSRIFASLSNRLSEGPFVSEEPNLPSGGHSGYRPEDYRTQSRRVRSQGLYRNQGQQPLGYSGSFTMPQLASGTTSVQPVMNATGTVPQTVMGYMGTAPQPVVNSGMNAVPGTAAQPAYPPMQQGYPAAQQPQGYPAMQQGYPPARQPAYPPAQQGYPAQTVPAQATVPQPPVQDHGRRKAAQAPTDYSMSTYSGAIPQMPAGYQQNWPQREQKPYQSKFRQEAPVPQQPERNRRAFQPQAQTPVPQPQPQMQPQMPLYQPQANNPMAQIPQNPNVAQPLRREGNVTYMPNLYVGNDGAAYRHVERLTQPMSASTCYRLIEFMRNGETVIVNTELIQDERENQRCLDLLYGAAYTMNCSFTRISAKSIYLIAPSTVSVISYESIRQMNEQDQAVRWPGNDSALLSGNRPRHAPVFGNARAAQ